MKIKKIGSLIIITVASSIVSFSLASAMEMNNQSFTPMKTDTIKKDAMMKDDIKKGGVMMDEGMKKSTMASDEIMMYEKITSASPKEDITKIQMMLVEKGNLVMPEGVAYGYYGKRTKAAYIKYKKMSMVKDTGIMKTDTIKKDVMIKDDVKKVDTVIAR